MKRIKLIISVLSMSLAGILLLSTVSSNGQDEQEKEPWKGKLKDGTVISRDDLTKIIREYEKWVETEGVKGQQANLYGADLSNANLYGANLSEADLRDANLSEAELEDVNLSEANLWDANLSKANLYGADLSNANLYGADLSGADLSNANLYGANLSGADLSNANLSGAILTGANLSNSRLTNTNLKDAIISGVDLSESKYEPNSSPHKGSLGGIKGLKSVLFEKERQSGLVQLRTALKESGLRDLEREATYAIERRKTHYEPWYKNWVKHFLFEWTCGYGLDYLQPLLILSCLILVFSTPYIYVLNKQSKDGIPNMYAPSRRKKDGIWIEWVSNRMRTDLGKNEPCLLKPCSFKNAMGNGFYFSVLSAFHIGWRDLNVGSWITRIQPREYTLKATGWVRVVSGVQSLISIYLLALWVLTQFGRPFD